MVQCKACPWKKGVRPEKDIPGGYSVRKHEALEATVQEGLRPGPMRMMACHDSPVGGERECVGWVVHQLGPGNNIGLRLLAMDGRYDNFRTIGPQHETFEDTLPKRARRAR